MFFYISKQVTLIKLRNSLLFEKVGENMVALIPIYKYGKIQELIYDNTVSEIMVNAPNEVWIFKKEFIHTDINFDSEEEVWSFAQRIALELKIPLNEYSPMLSAILPNGYHMDIIIPPVSMKGTTIVIRK